MVPLKISVNRRESNTWWSATRHRHQPCGGVVTNSILFQNDANPSCDGLTSCLLLLHISNNVCIILLYSTTVTTCQVSCYVSHQFDAADNLIES